MPFFWLRLRRDMKKSGLSQAQAKALVDFQELSGSAADCFNA
jgi:hypothetical protein